MGKRTGCIIAIAVLILVVSAVYLYMNNNRQEPETYTKTGVDIDEESYDLTVYNYVPDLTIKESEFNPETDWDWRFLNGGSASYMAVVGDTHYIRLYDYVYVCSPETGEMLPLCAKPDCLHDKEEDYKLTADCTANVLTGFVWDNIQYYQGKLYANAFAKANYTENSDLTDSTFPGDYVAELSLDGTKKDFLNAKCDSAYDLLIHRGKIYYINVASGGAKDTYEVREVPMEGGDYHVIATLKSGMGTHFDVFCYGNCLYLVVDKTLILYDILNQTATIKEISVSGISLYAFDNVLYGTKNSVDGTQIYTLDEGTGGLEHYLTLQNASPDELGMDVSLNSRNPRISMDEDYIYQIVQTNDADWLIVYDRNDGKSLQRIDLKGLNYYVRPGIEDDKIWLVPFLDQDAPVLWLEKDRILEEGVTFHEITR